MDRSFSGKGKDQPGFYTDFSKKCSGIMNTFGSAYDSERTMLAMQVTEFYNNRGVKSEFYATTQDTKYDPLFGDDDDRRIERKFELMIFYNYPKEEKLWTSFGIEGLDNFSMFCSKEHFNAMCVTDENGDDVYDIIVPKVGDLIRVEFNNYIYEITEVKDEAAMWLQSKQYSWEFVVKPFINEHLGTEDLPVDDEVRKVIETSDTFDISQDLDDAVEEIKYEPEGEYDIDFDPFGNWN